MSDAHTNAHTNDAAQTRGPSTAIFIDKDAFMMLAVKASPKGDLAFDGWGEFVKLGPFSIRPAGGGYPVCYEQVKRLGLPTSTEQAILDKINEVWRYVGERVVVEARTGAR